MKTNDSLLKKTGIYAIGTFGSKILTFLLIPFYSFYLDREEFGYYDLVITAINLLVPFITLQISDGVFRWLITAKTDRDRQIALSSSVFIALLGLVVCGVICGITFMIWPIQRHVLITALSLSAIL